jgi:pimeloyl-ACP methyl ester carboxylesterase
MLTMTRRVRVHSTRSAAALLVLLAVRVGDAAAETTATFTLRGHDLTLHLWGPPAGDPVILASGDGGWIHLGPAAAAILARAGYSVVGVDSKQYLSAFTSGKTTLSERDVQQDFGTLIAYAAKGRRAKPILIGVSEGAGLSVLAATDPTVKRAVRGVVGLGLPDLNELGWRWKDAIIYITKGVPDEPTFSVDRLIGRVAPVPLAALHSSNDEFVPVPVITRMMERAQEPKRLWIIRASNHAFSGSEAEFERRLLEALAWIKSLTAPAAGG